jgi:hypothetical protein
VPARQEQRYPPQTNQSTSDSSCHYRLLAAHTRTCTLSADPHCGLRCSCPLIKRWISHPRFLTNGGKREACWARRPPRTSLLHTRSISPRPQPIDRARRTDCPLPGRVGRMSISQHAQVMVPPTGPPMSRSITTRYSAARPAVLSIAKLAFTLAANLPFLRASPVSASRASPALSFAGGEGKSPDDPRLWIYLSTAVALVLLGGAFAGLTIAYVVPRAPYAHSSLSCLIF